MSILDEMEKVIYEDKEVTEEGITDVIKTGIKLLPALVTIFQLATTNVNAGPSYKNDIETALIDMQESRSKDVLDVTSNKVQRLISKVKDLKVKKQMINDFNKAYHMIANKLS